MSALHVRGMNTALLQIMKSKKSKFVQQAFTGFCIIPAKISTYSTEFPAGKIVPWCKRGARCITKTSSSIHVVCIHFV